MDSVNGLNACARGLAECMFGAELLAERDVGHRYTSQWRRLIIMKKLTGKVVKRRRTVVESLVLVVLALVTASCAREIATYPPEWAPIDRRSDCEWIVGTYQNMSDAAPYPSTGYRHSLRMTEIMRFHAPHLGGDKVTLSFPEPGVLQIKGDGEQHFRFKKDDAACHDGHLELRSSDHDARYWSTMWGHDTITLTRSTDGALIARRDLSHWIFLFGFIPTHGFVREWYRFAPVSRN